jgi:hypothetical protein
MLSHPANFQGSIIDSLKTRTPARFESGLAGYGWPPAIEIQHTIGVRT